MKKVLALILVLALAAAFPLSASADIELVNENIAITVDKAAVAPVIDGVLDADSYGKISATINDYRVYGSEEHDAWMSSNLPDAYISYDANNLYVFLGGSTANYACDHTIDTAGNIWDQSCIQISVSTADASGSERLEIGLARNSETGEQIPNVWAQGNVDGYGTTEYVMTQGQNFAIALEGDKLNYEVAIPWTAFLPAVPAAGGTFGFNFIYGWYPDVRMGVEFSQGCGASKAADLFAKVTLTENVLQAAPVVVDEPAADEPAADAGEAPVAAAPVAPSAVKTGDTGMIILVSIMAIAAVGVVILRKKTAK